MKSTLLAAIALVCTLSTAFGAVDESLRMALTHSRSLLNNALRSGSAFPGQVSNAFAELEDQQETTAAYLQRGSELRNLIATVNAQVDAIAARHAGGSSVAESAAIQRRAQSALTTAQLYLHLPRNVADLDTRPEQDPAIRSFFVRAMIAIAADADYNQASALEIRAIEESRRPNQRH